MTGLVAAEQVLSTTVEGGAIAAYGLAQSTQPLSSTFKRVSSPAFLPRSNHSLTVIADRAYIFGGEDENKKLAGDEVHIITLPLKNKKGNHDGEVDYKCVPSLGEGQDGKVPGPRAGHMAVAIGERVYLFGGKGDDGQAIEEMGRIWVFDTNTLGWSYIDPASDTSTTSVPPARYHHGAASSEHPLPQTNASSKASYTEQLTSTIAKLPSLMSKASSPQEPHGSLIICSGLSSSSSPLNDTWLFNITTRIWSALPSTPSTSPSPPSMALTYNRLYLITSTSNLESEIHFLPITKETYNDARGEGEVGLKSLKNEWTTLPFPTNPLAPGPRPRKGAGLMPVTTGNGREYLLYFLGERDTTTTTTTTTTKSKQPSETAEKEEEEEDKDNEKEEPTFWSDTYSYQVPAIPITAAGIKDATRQAMGIATGEDTWAEVKVEAGVESKEKESEGKAHPGPRGWFASCVVPSQPGSVVIWGGVNGKGETEGDGWLVDIGTAK